MSTERVHVIACGVLAIDIRHVARQFDLQIEATYLPGGLHNNPKELRRRLQETIDAVSASGSVTQIAIGYGVCGQGAVGIHARQAPLAIPRVHDCIALFLGSDAAYRREFARYPGTYYISAGWVTEKVQPKSAGSDGCGSGAANGSGQQDACSAPSAGDPEFQRLVAQHGSENAEAIRHFLTSWQRNYQRAAFIDTGAAEHQRYARIAQDMAGRYGWRYEQLDGSGELLKKLLLCRATSPEVLWVPPHHVTAYDAVGRGLQAVPAWEADRAGDQQNRDQVIEVGSDGDSGSRQSRLGLGIDAGGTYTDVVLYEFATDRVLQKAKALTTKWDYTIGISNALDQLDRDRLTQVDLAAVSTTLATNAIVEGRGQKVGLLIMPPYGLFNDEDIAHRPLAVIEGQLEINGAERQPINEQQVRQVVRRMVADQQVGAFAVTGYASHINPAHEMEVRRIVEAETGLPVTCGHDVSEQLGYCVRAQTAALNARIIPILVAFLKQAGQCLRHRSITAPVMVVRSDGSLMSVQTARQRPIETILSGPAASVAGARYLAKAPTAFVVDVGGTTTDTALIVGGSVCTSREGARVGGWQTHVQALDMRTCGLGGDSLIACVERKLRIGPRRVGPIAWLGTWHPAGLEECFRWIEGELAKNAPPPAQLLDIYVLNGHPAHDAALTERERRIVQALTARPHCGHELISRVQQNWWEVLDLDRLEREHLVQRCGLTPTDLLHATGRFQRWDTAAARRMLALFGRAMNGDEAKLAEQALDLFVRRLALEVFKKQLDGQLDERQGDADDVERLGVCRALMDNWLGSGSPDYHVRVCLKHPIIGIGAPVGHFLPAAAALLETEAIVPEHADVANAIGAITSSVVIHRQVEISPDVNGRYAVHGLPGSPLFTELHEARAAAMEALREIVTAAARAAGTSRSRIQFTIRDHVAPLGEAGQVFVGETVQARLAGRPDLTCLV